MKKTPIDELARLATLRTLKILDTGPEAAFDMAVNFIAAACNAPIALVSLVDDHRQWFKAKVGTDLCETAREDAFCAHAIECDGLFEVPDATADARFAANPLVVNAPFIRFYAGLPLRLSCGSAVGTLCVIDTVPRRLGDQALAALRAMAEQLTTILDQRYALQMGAELRSRESALHDKLLREAIERNERRNVALHEGIAQDLTGAKLLIGGLAESSYVTAGGRPRMAILNNLIGTAIADCRQLATEEGGISLRNEGLPGALRQLAVRADAVESGARVRARTELADGRRLDPTIEHHLYRIAVSVLEAALGMPLVTEVSLLLEASDRTVDFALVTDGDLAVDGHDSVLEMAGFRASLLGGSLRLSSDINRHSLLVRVPCRAPDDTVTLQTLPAAAAAVG